MKGYVDLHLHLDGSLSVKMARKLAVAQIAERDDTATQDEAVTWDDVSMQDIRLPDSDEELELLLKCPKDCKDLNDYLKCFELPLQLLQTRSSIADAVYLLQEELKEQGLIYAEIRFAPQLHCRRGLTQQEVVSAAVKGLRASDFEANLILCCMRGDTNQEANLETVQVAKHFQNQGVVAIDLAGAEGLYPTEEFHEEFALAREWNVPFTIHAGEAAGAMSIRRAVEFGAKRIGHGVRAFEDGSLMKVLAKKRIALELCPKSNLDTRVFDTIQEYPILTFLEHGVPITINTDNMEVSDTTVTKEMERIQHAFSLTDEQVLQIEMTAIDVSFADNSMKEILRRRLKEQLV